jgi:hypothetical protein
MPWTGEVRAATVENNVPKPEVPPVLVMIDTP